MRRPLSRAGALGLQVSCLGHADCLTDWPRFPIVLGMPGSAAGAS